MKRLLLGTANPAKIARTRAYLAPLPVVVLCPADLGLVLRVPEGGEYVLDNAIGKARAYHATSGLAVLANDAALYIAGFPPEKQPGMFARRVRGTGQDVDDAEVREYYLRELRAAGGERCGTWHVGLALVTASGQLLHAVFKLEAQFTARPSPVRLRGEPLSTLMCDAATGRYYAEMADDERPDAAPIREFVARHLDKL